MPTSPFTLSRATTPQDLLQIVSCEYASFPSHFIRSIFMGPDTPSNHETLSQTYLRCSREDPGDFWIKVTEKSTGKIVAASNWRVYPGGVPKHKEEMGLEWLENNTEEKEKATKVLENIVAMRERLFVEPYLQLYICFTHPDYQRRGLGSMMLKWGCELADQLFLPAWVEASPDGNHLYKVFGFETVEENKGDIEGCTMRREPRVQEIEGGKAV